MIELEVQLFGPLRKYGAKKHGDEQVVLLKLDSESTVAEIKNHLQIQLGGEKLVGISALANETRVLSEHEKISTSGRFAILPPVCGG